jgi:hypothetical protein
MDILTSVGKQPRKHPFPEETDYQQGTATTSTDTQASTAPESGFAAARN